jgi:predicted dehydrogenase
MLRKDTHPAKLRAIVIGAGFAGEGHTRALQYVGVDVIALCARQPTIVRAMAERLGVPIASTDWRATLEEIQPDIVALGTPASLRREVIEAAVAQGCHLYCDKPLAITAPEAADLCRIVEEAGIKHAYAATRRYDPSVVWLAELVREGAIGRLSEIVFTLRTSLTPVLPWFWALMLEQGGGLLNNHFVHLLSILEQIVSGRLVRVMGQANFDIDRAPYLPDIHDFRDWAARADTLTPEELESAEWRDCDADTSYSALMRFAAPTGEVPVTLISGPGATASDESSGMRIRGELGTLIARGEVSFQVSRVLGSETLETELPIPERLIVALPKVGGGCEDRWAALAQEFVADIRGESHQPYLTFRDGWRYQEAIDAIRSGRGGYELPL